VKGQVMHSHKGTSKIMVLWFAFSYFIHKWKHKNLTEISLLLAGMCHILHVRHRKEILCS
jgi:hypothetical protein